MLLKSINLFNLSVITKTRRVSTFKFVNKNRIRNYSKSTIELNENYENSGSETKDNECISDSLIKWAIQNNISYHAFSRLLKVLSEHGIDDLPTNAKSLLEAKESEVKVTKVPPGTYTHFGLKKNLKKLISELIDKKQFNKSDICVSVFVDQLPLVTLTRRNLWVILGSVEGFTDKIIFIGAYHGYSKPKSSNLFLSEFVTEAKILSKLGLEINNVIYPVRIQRLICDARAKAFVLNIKDFNGYSSCTKCTAVGEYKNKKICFFEISTLRKDEDFEKDEIYVNGKSILLEIPTFGMVSRVPLDYMHLVCLGVVKKLLSIWLSNEKYWNCEKSASSMIKTLVYLYPCEFEKKPKSLKHPRWVASDFREFLLYYGPVVLKNNLKENYYNHFLQLHIACRLLCMEVSKENIDYGRKLLTNFVENYISLYKTEQVTHNIHGLYHLADECNIHGSLDNFSAFPFENFLVKLKNSMKRLKKKTIPQIILKESYDIIFTKNISQLQVEAYKLKKKLKITEEPFQDFYHYEKLSLKTFDIIPSSESDKYVILKNNKLFEVTNILGNKNKSNKTHFVSGKEFTSVSNFHSEPYEALQLNMFRVRDSSQVEGLWPVDMIDKKLMKIPETNEESVMVGLLDHNY